MIVEGNGFTVTAVVTPQPVGKVYDIVTVPAATPVTLPDPSTVATEPALLVQLPPVEVSPRVVIEPPSQTAIVPVMVAGIGLMVTAWVAIAVPQELVTVYKTVSMPAVAPVTVVPVTIAWPFEALHVPPVVASATVIAPTAHMLDGPVMVPAVGVAITVIVEVAYKVPQLLVTV